MCESEPHGASVSGGSPSVERINAPSPDAQEAPASPRDSLLTKDSEDGNQNAPEIMEKEASGVPRGPDGDSNLRRDSVGTRVSSLLAPGTSKDSLAEDSDEVEGIDPFSVKPTDMVDSRLSRQLSERRGSKTVNFKEPEVEVAPTQNGSSPASSKGEEPVEEEGINEKHSNKQWSLGESNPVYRLSMKLSPNLFNMTEIPGASQHREAEKVGYLTKLSGRSFPYIPQWKRRYCVLAKGRLYYYEREDSKTGEKANGVINLEYFDHVAEAAPKDCKKATNVFVITSQDRSFFDPGRHLFSAESLPDMKDWIKRLQAALEQIRNNNRPVTTTSTKESIKRRKEENLENKDKAQNKENQQGVTREKKKKKTEESHRPHKPGVSHETQTLTVEPTSVTSVKEVELQTMTSPKGGVQLPGLTSHKGIQLPGLSTKKELQDAEVTESPEVNKEELPMSGPTLLCVTKQRVKGPQGRRAPQNHRRTLAATALKKRASSLSALEYQDLNDNSEEPWCNRSLDVLEDGGVGGSGAPGGTSSGPTLPYKAYNYSSEDDVDDDGDISHSDSFPTSASGMLPPPPPPPPRSASFGLELRHDPPLGLQALHNSLGDARGLQGDLGGSKRSLSNGRIYGMVGEWQKAAWGGSRSSLRQNGDVTGRASPVMDDLDNMLMNQSIQHTSGIMDSTSDAGSEGSTCRAADQPHQQCSHRRYQQHQHQRQQQQHQRQQQQQQRQQQQQQRQQQQQQQRQQQQQHQERKKSHDLSRFATAVRHLQRHVVEVDRAVFNITSDIADTRQEVTTLKEAVLALQVDTHTITTTLSNLTQEAITAQEKISFATQIRADFKEPAKEAERVQHAANLALRDAERARHDHQNSKREYDELVAEMKIVLKDLRESQATAGAQTLATTQGQPQTRNSNSCNESTSAKCQCVKVQDQSHKTTGDSTTKSSHEHKATKAAEGSAANQFPASSSPKSARASSGSISTSSASSRASVGSSTGSSRATVVSKSSASTQAASAGKTTGYQSLFAKPSSIISGLTSRHSLTKSVSFADQNNKEKTKSEAANIKPTSSEKNKKDEKREKKDDKHQSTLERKNKKDSKHHKDKKHSSTDTGSMERRSKDKKDNSERKDASSIDRKERKGRHEHKDKKCSLQEAKDSGNIISQISLDDIPMVDDNSQELLDQPEEPQAKVSTVCITCSSNEVSLKPSFNFSLGKSSSLPTVPCVGPTSRSRALPLKRDHRVEQSTSNTSSPESPTAPSPFPRPSSGLSPLEESPPISESSSVSSLHRPGSTPGPLARQGSMTTVPEDCEVAGPPPTKRPGVFAISRQNSTPNIPLQRQNSGPIFPLQRQHSLGVVPEEGRLPRQDSLMSVPEERPIVDQTLPLSPAQSMTQFPLSPTASSTTLSESARRAARESMELVTGPVLAGSSMQEAAATGTLPVLNITDEDNQPSATSTLKKDHKPPTDVVGILV